MNKEKVPDRTVSLETAEPDMASSSSIGYLGYAEYFHNKELQQLESDVQYREKYQKEKGVSHPTLFQGLTIYVNGRTDPTRFELHKLIILHGGTFKHYLSGKTAVTHIIASELNASKKSSFANYKIVGPGWITESIARGKLLPWQDFRIVNVSVLQGKITDFATIRNCMDPNFIHSYFKSSRLHHLSNWKFQLRDQFVQDLLSSRGEISPNQKYVFFHVDFDCFFAQVSAKIDGTYDIHTVPIAISHGINNSDISSCNYVARSFGVHNGMWVSSALKLCPALKILDYEFDEYEAISNLFYQALKSVGIFKMVLPLSIDEAIGCMPVTSDTTQELLTQKCIQVRAAVFDLTQGYSVSIGCASSVLLARLALRKGKPNGFSISWFSTPLERRAFVDQFKLKDLPGIGYSTDQKIQETFGEIHSISALRGLLESPNNVSKLIKAIGSKNAKRLQTYLDGQDDDESISMVKDPASYFQKKSLSVEINYAIRFKTIDDVDTFLERLSLYLWEKLKDSNLLTRQITLKLMKRAQGAPVDPPKFMGMGKCDAISKASTLGSNTQKYGSIASECKTLFRILSVPPAEVRGIGLQFHRLTAATQASGQKLEQRRITTDIFKKANRSDDEVVRRVDEDTTPRTPKSTTYASPVKNYWDRHLKRSVTPFRYDFPDELDPEFMSNLPKDVQEEITSHHSVAKRAKRTLRTELFEEPKKQIKQTQDLHYIHDGRLVPQLSFQGLSSAKQICRTLIDWVDATIDVGPHEKDLELFVNHLNKLADQRRSHIILQLIKTLKNKIDDHYDGNSEGLEQWEYFLIRRLIPVLNKTKSDVNFNLVFDL
ncbi:unnamed protein product [Kluyveromyces dobzhanskii CBS 2104]|uniref:DNA repair protein REV1 n=1 Tax=Kluyveromyces dobzhanskii CBS 2104 TaxID=1427455 RepID=A0A0A8LDE8_9SACH|nr:unnamed protein product [Kluyveromyces dobzhanskii CBS 2104]